MQKQPSSTPTISQFAMARAKKLTVKVTLWSVACFSVMTLLGVSYFHYANINQGMTAMSEGLAPTLGLGGDYIPKHIMKGALSTGSFQGFWAFDDKGQPIASRVNIESLAYDKEAGPTLDFKDGYLLVFKSSSFDLNGEYLGSVVGAYRIPLMPIFALIGILCGLIILISYTINRSITKMAEDVSTPITEMTGEVQNLSSSNKKWNLLEVDDLYHTFKKYMKASKETEEKVRSSLVAKEVASIAYKVKHDIKASLYIAEGKLNEIPEDQNSLRISFKRLFERIYNIADDIPKFEGVSGELERENTKHNIQTCHVASVVSEIVTEFSTSSIEDKEIEFQTEFRNESFHRYADVDITKLKRVLVNLLKNSAEAIQNTGLVVVSLSNDEDHLFIEVKDNGLGMTEEQLEKVGRPGVSFKNGSGTGLGLSSAIENIKRWNGSCGIDSKARVGTTVRVLLPLADENLLLPTQIFVEPETEVIVADDDPLYLQLYKEKLSGKVFKNASIRLKTFSELADVENHMRKLVTTGKRFLLVTDNDYGDERFGLNLVSDLGIEDRSVVISSNGTSPNFLAECSEKSIVSISKAVASSIQFLPAT